MIFPLEDSSWSGSATESLWVDPIGNGKYVIENTPFYFFGVSYQDVVLGQERNGELTFDSVLARGGHSTYRIIVVDRGGFEQYWQPLADMGCTYEGGPNGLLAVDVPPRADIYAAYLAMDVGEKAGTWSYEEGHCGHPTDGGKLGLN